MAHKKGTGSTRNGRDSNSKRLGVKAYGGEKVTAGSILILLLYLIGIFSKEKKMNIRFISTTLKLLKNFLRLFNQIF